MALLFESLQIMPDANFYSKLYFGAHFDQILERGQLLGVSIIQLLPETPKKPWGSSLHFPVGHQQGGCLLQDAWVWRELIVLGNAPDGLEIHIPVMRLLKCSQRQERH